MSKSEIQLGRSAARTLQKDLRSVIRNKTEKQTGKLSKTKVSAKADKFDNLNKLTISTEDYAFKLHYGFEGVKSNGVLMKLKPTDHFNLAFEKSNALEKLADEIGSIRADEIVAAIKL